MNYNCCLQSQILTVIDPNLVFSNPMPVGGNENIKEVQPFIITSQIPNANLSHCDQNIQYNCTPNDSSSDSYELEKNYCYLSASDNTNFKDYSMKSKSFSSSLSNIQYNQRRKFTPEEDNKLKKIISIYGAKKWDKVALMMPGRTGRQCRDRFHNYLSPSLVNGPWTKEEDKILEQKVLEYGQHWNKISKFFKGRSDNNIKNRWHTYISRHRQFLDKELSNLNDNKKDDDQISSKIENDNCHIYTAEEKSKNDINFDNYSPINYLNDSTSNTHNSVNICLAKSLKNKLNDGNNILDVIPIKSENGNRTLFPPIVPSDENLILPLNHGMLNFLSQFLDH